jgi:hypothetical protein
MRVTCFGITFWYHSMQARHRRTLELIAVHPASGNVRWADVEALFRHLGGTIREAEGSRIAVVLFGEVRVFHRPHPRPDADKGAVASVQKWLKSNGVIA